MIAILLSSIAGLLPTLLADVGVKTTLANLISASLAAFSALWADFKSGASALSASETALTALQAEFTAVKNDTSVSPAVIGAIAEVSNLVDDALIGWTNAQVVDPGTLPVPPAVS